MNKQEYLEELKKRLQGAAQEDIEDALRYCEEYFEDAGIEHEEQVIDELGNPAKFAAQIKAESVIRKNVGKENNEKKNPKTSLKNVIVIFLGLCALPIAVPLMFAIVMLFFAFAMVVFALVLAAIVSVGAIFISGIPLIISGFTNMATPGNSLIAFGGGCLSIGFGILLLILFISLIRIIIPAFMQLITKLYHKAKGGRRNEKA